MTKIGITGAQGKIGKELVSLGGIPIDGDITNEVKIKKVIEKINPDVIIHCAGLSDIDVCERDWEECYKVNVRGVSNVNFDENRPFILLSSDHVFDGKKGKYKENSISRYRSLGKVSNYGLSKCGAESYVRTWGGKIIRLSTTFNEEKIKNILISSCRGIPTFIKRSYAYVGHIAEGLMYFANNYNKMPPVLHIAGTEILSMYDFYCLVYSTFGYKYSSISSRTKPDTSLVARPFKGGLNISLAKKLGVPLYSATDGLKLLKEKFDTESK